MPRITVSEILTPVGDLDESVLFPGVDSTVVRNQLEQWINDGFAALAIAEIDENDEQANSAVENFVLAKAYRKRYVEMIGSPLRASIDNEASDEYSIEQIREFNKLAIEYSNAFNAIIGEILSVEVIDSSTVSRALENEYTW